MIILQIISNIMATILAIIMIISIYTNYRLASPVSQLNRILNIYQFVSIKCKEKDIGKIVKYFNKSNNRTILNIKYDYSEDNVNYYVISNYESDNKDYRDTLFYFVAGEFINMEEFIKEHYEEE